MSGGRFYRRQLNPFYTKLREIFGHGADYADKSGNTGRRRYVWGLSGKPPGPYAAAVECCVRFRVAYRHQIDRQYNRFIAYFDPDCPELWARVLCAAAGFDPAAGPPANAIIDRLYDIAYDPEVVAKFRSLTLKGD